MFDKTHLRTGKAFVDKWMQEKCNLIRLPEDRDANTVLPDLMHYVEQFRGIAGQKCFGQFFLLLQFQSWVAIWGLNFWDWAL